MKQAEGVGTDRREEQVDFTGGLFDRRESIIFTAHHIP
jgi:hypothetical protein